MIGLLKYLFEVDGKIPYIQIILSLLIGAAGALLYTRFAKQQATIQRVEHVVQNKLVEPTPQRVSTASVLKSTTEPPVAFNETQYSDSDNDDEEDDTEYDSDEYEDEEDQDEEVDQQGN